MSSGVTLRPYQQAAVDAVLTGFKEHRRLLGVAATGLGKTVIFTAVARALGLPTLMLAHREELLQQAEATFRTMWPEAHTGIIQADRNETGADVTLAMVQTLARPKRLAQVQQPGLIIVDEAHHSLANSYRKVLDHFGAFGTDGPLVLGVTATADRGDKRGLGAIFDEIAFHYDINWGIQFQWLCPLRGKRITLETDLKKVRSRAGDFVQEELDRALTQANAPGHILEAWRQHAAGRLTLCFTPSVAMAEEVARRFNEAGIPAAALSGSTPEDERAEIIRRYRTGEIQVLANCAVLTEGFDAPETSCIIMARPTKSRPLYAQCIGRGTRLADGKQDCLVLDVVGVTEVHDLCVLPTLVGEADDKPEQGDVCSRRSAEKRPQVPYFREMYGILKARDVELLGSKTGIAWVALNEVTRALSVKDVLTVIHPRADGTWMALFVREGRVFQVNRYSTLEKALYTIGAKATEVAGPLVDRSARWRRREASDAQRRLIRRLGGDPKRVATMGDASDTITYLQAARILEQLNTIAVQ